MIIVPPLVVFGRFMTLGQEITMKDWLLLAVGIIFLVMVVMIIVIFSVIAAISMIGVVLILASFIMIFANASIGSFALAVFILACIGSIMAITIVLVIIAHPCVCHSTVRLGSRGHLLLQQIIYFEFVFFQSIMTIIADEVMMTITITFAVDTVYIVLAVERSYVSSAGWRNFIPRSCTHFAIFE